MNTAQRFLTVFCILLVLFGCASKKTKTLKGMSYQKIDVSESKVTKVETKKVMTRYRQFLDDAPVNHPLYADAVNRLADLEMIEGDRKVFIDKEEKYVEAVEAMSNTQEADGTRNYENAINLYENLLKANPKDRRADWIMYQLSRAYEQKGDLEGAARTLSRLLKAHRNSQFAPESRFRLAEILYTLRDYPQAEIAYKQVLAMGRKNQFYEKAVYKLGWSLFKQEKYNKALDQFFVAMQLLPISYGPDGRVATTGLTQLEKDLVADIFRVINLCFSYSGGTRAVATYFNRNPNDRLEFEIYHRLGEFYVNVDRIEDAANTYGQYVNHHKSSPRSAQMQLLKIDVYTKGGFFQRSLAAREEFIQNFASKQRFWEGMSLDQRRSNGRKVKEILTELTQYYHSRAQKSRRVDDYRLSIRWYEILVKMFPGEDTLEQQLLLAELLYETGKYEKAIKHFEYIAYDLPKHKRTSDAAYSALLSHEKIIKKNRAKNRAILYGAYIKSSFRFLSWFPNDKRAIAVRVTTAERLFTLKRYDEAVLQAKTLVQTDKLPNRPFIAAHTILGHVAFDKEDYSTAAFSYEKVLSKKISKKKRIALNKKLSVASFKVAETLRARGDMAGAATVFMKTADISSNSDIKAKSIYDAATVYIAQEQWDKALPLLNKFVKQYTKHQLTKDAYEKLVVVNEKLGQEDAKVAAMVWLASRENDLTRKRGFYWSIATVYKQKNKLSEASQYYEKHYKTYATPSAESLESMYEVATINHRLKRYKTRNRLYRKLIKTVDTSNLKNQDRAKTLAAESAFVLAESEWHRYKSVRLTLPLKKSMARKKKLMTRALSAYDKVASYAISEFTTASTHRVAEIYAELGSSVMHSARPRGLDAEEKEMYALQLEEQAFPFEEKAIEIYESNAARVKDGTYDEWIRKSFLALSKLQPVRYGKDEQVEVAFDAVF